MATRINIPISVSDVAECLGVTTLDVGKLCTSDAVSAWAKYKPTRIASNPITTPDNWWQADQNTGNDCGFDVPILTLNTGALNSNSLINLFTDDGNNNWNYLQPTTGYWKRLLDFNGYYHLAAPPFSLLSTTINVYEGEESVIIQPAVRAYAGDDILKIKDFAFAAETKYYLGAFLVGTVSSTNYYKRHISTYEVTADTLGDMSESSGNLPTLPISDLPAGSYTIYTILGSASVGYDEGNGDEEPNQAISVMPCPCVPPITLNVLQKSIVFTFTVGGKLSRTTLEITPTFTFENKSIGDVVLSELTFSFLPDGASSTATSSITIGSRDVAFGGSYNYGDDLQQIFLATSGYTSAWIKVQFRVKDSNGNYLNEYGEVGNKLFERASMLLVQIV